jgi:AhpC/TSA family
MERIALITCLLLLFWYKSQAQNWQISEKVPTIHNEDGSKIADKLLWIYLPSTSPKCTYSGMLLAAFNQYFASGNALNQKIEVQVIVQDTTYISANIFRNKPFAQNVNIIYLIHHNRHLIQKYGLLGFDSLNHGAKVYFFDHKKVVYKNDNYTAVGNQLKALEIAISKNLNVYTPIKKIASRILKIGDQAPPIFDENGVLHDYSKANTIVSFYPAAFSGVLNIDSEENNRASAAAGKQFQSRYGIKSLDLNYLQPHKTATIPVQRISKLEMPIFFPKNDTLQAHKLADIQKLKLSEKKYGQSVISDSPQATVVLPPSPYSQIIRQESGHRVIMCYEQPNLLSGYALVLDKSLVNYGLKTKVFAITNTTSGILDAWKEIQAMPSVNFINDADFKIAQQFNSFNNQGYCKRSIFIIDRKGIIRFSDTDFEYDDEAKIQAVLAEINGNK